MRKTTLMMTIALLCALGAAAQTQTSASPSLGEAARKARQERANRPKPRHVLTNDVSNAEADEQSKRLAKSGKDTRFGDDEPQSEADAKTQAKPTTPGAPEAAPGAPAAPNAKPGEAPPSGAEQAKPAMAGANADELQKRVSDLRSRIDMLNHDIDINRREMQIRASEYRSNGVAQVQNRGEYNDFIKKRQDEIDAKTKQLEESQRQLEAAQEEARRTGVVLR